MRLTGEQAIQGSEQWLEVRKGKRTASTSPVIMGLSPFKTKEAYAKEVLSGVNKTFYSQAMKDGNDFEAAIRDIAEDRLDKIFSPAVYVEGDYLASLDGICADETTLIEIKLSKKTYDEVKKGNIPEYYEIQIQHQFMCSGATKGYLFAGFLNENRVIEDVVHIEVPRNARKIAKIKKEWDDWEWYVANYEEEIREDKEWQDAADAYSVADAQIKQLTEVKNKAKEVLQELAGGHKAKGMGIQTYTAKNSLTINYKQICEDNEAILSAIVDYDKYTKVKKGGFTVKAYNVDQ